MKPIKTALVGLAFLSTDAAFSDQQCTMNGEAVNLNNGASTAGKTGIVICKNEKGEIVRKREYKNGIEDGLFYMKDYSGNIIEGNRDKNNRPLGSQKTTGPSGKVIKIENYVDGKLQGLQKAFYDDGSLKTLSAYDGKSMPSMEIHYNKNGTLYSLRCGDKSFSDEDKKYCGFGSASQVTLFKSDGTTKAQTIAFQDGKKQNAVAVQANGQVAEKSEWVNGQEHRKTFYDSGAIKTDAVYKGRFPVSKIEYYMNGHKKSAAVFDTRENKVTRHFIEYYDTGKVAQDGDWVFRGGDDWWGSGYSPIGKHFSYWENGKMREETNFNSDSKLDGETNSYNQDGVQIVSTTYQANKATREKRFDKHGTLISDKQIFPDGSSKELLAPPAKNPNAI